MIDNTYSAWLTHFAELLEDAVDTPVTIGALPPGNGIAITYASGEYTRDMAGGGYMEAMMIINAKHADQARAMDDIGDAQRTLCSADLPDIPGQWQLLGVSIAALPTYMGQSTDGLHIYGSTVRARIFIPPGGAL